MKKTITLDYNENESFYILADKSRNYDDDGWHISYFEKMHNGELWYTQDITEAKRFTRAELLEIIAERYVHGLIILNYTEEYFNRIKGNKDIIKRLATLEGF